MSLNPQDWNVVVVGRWNRAILTPSGIAFRLFDLPKGTPVKVAVPLDSYGPYQVEHNGVTVTAGSDRLMVAAVEPTFNNLEEAKIVAARAIEKLPETPFSAAGINVRYQSTEIVGDLAKVTRHDTDSKLTDKDHEILARLHQRTIRWEEGKINISVDQQPDNNYTIQFNFDLTMEEWDKLQAWLKTPIEKIESVTEELLEAYLGLTREDYKDDERE